MPLLTLLLAPAALAGARPISPQYQGNCQSPVWSADGRKLAYEVNYHDRKVIELYVYEPGKEPRQVRPLDRGTSSLTAGFSGAGAENVAHEASWGPAKIDRFVYSASTSAKDYDLAIDQAGPIAVAPGADGNADWSPDGRWIVFTSARTGQGDLYLVDVNHIDQPPRQLTHNPVSSELYASFSPDSKSIIFVGHTDNGDNLYIIDDVGAVGARPRQLTTWARTQTRPSWSPDGKRFAFYSNHDKAERFDLYVASLGSNPYPLAQGVVMSHDGPVWTPDGASIVYVQDNDDQYDPIWITPYADSGGAHKLATDTVGNGDVDVARGTDGRTWMAVAAQGLASDKVRDFKRIYVMPID